MALIEQVARRGRKEKHYYDTDTNKYRAEFTIHDRHYKDENDQWQEVDENFVDDGLDGFAKKSDKQRHAIRIGNGGARRWYPRRNVATEYVDITTIQYYTNRWRNLNLPTPAWTNNHTTWDMANLTATLTNTWRRIKADFILKDNTAPTRLRFAVGFVGLTYNAETGELTSTTDGLVWGKIDTPTAHDANGVTVPVTATYAGGYIEWSADTTGATYPVTVDPTFTDGYGGDVDTAKDTYIRSSLATTNFGGSNVTNVGYYSTPQINRGLIEFTLSSISGTATCDSASLYFYNAQNDDAGVNATLEAYRCKRDWVENQATWNIYSTGNNWGTAGCDDTTNDREASNIGTATLTNGMAAGTEIVVSLTASAVQDWWDGGLTNEGLLLKNSAENVNNIFYLATSDHATTGYRPKLVVAYTEAAGGDPEGSLIGGKLIRGGLLTHGVLVGD